MTILFGLFVIAFIAIGLGVLNRLQLLIDRIDSAAGVFSDLRDDLRELLTRNKT